MRRQKKKSRHSKHPHNRQYKDRLWRMIFNNKEDLLQLYNAINHTDYRVRHKYYALLQIMMLG